MTSTDGKRGGPSWPAALISLGLLLAGPALAAEPPEERRAELRYLLRQDCGSCHGMRLTGGLGPALTPEALAGRSIAELRATILYGRPGTAMPPWADFLSDAEADWLARQLKSGELGEISRR